MSSERQAIAEDIHPLLATRWSTVNFDRERDVPPAVLARLFEAARWAPSCYNAQPWRFIVWQRSDDPAAYERARACAVSGNRRWLDAAPVLIAVLGDTRFEHGGDNRWAGYDAGAAALSLCLQANAEGLNAHQIGGFDEVQLASEFELPENIRPMAMIALGYVGDPQQLDASLAKRENKPRERKPSDQWLFFNRWTPPRD